MVNRLALSVLTAGFIVGLAILTLAYQPPGWGLLSRLAFLVGALVYFILAKIGLQSRVLPYGPAMEQKAA